MQNEKLEDFHKFWKDYVETKIRFEKCSTELKLLRNKVESLNSELNNSIFDFSVFEHKFNKFMDEFQKEFNILLSSIPLRTNLNLPVKVWSRVFGKDEIKESSYVISSRFGLKYYRTKSTAEIPLAYSGPKELLYLSSIKELPKKYCYDKEKLEKAIKFYKQMIKGFCLNERFEYFFNLEPHIIPISNNLKGIIYLHDSYFLKFRLKVREKDMDFNLLSIHDTSEDTEFFEETLRHWDSLYKKLEEEHQQLSSKVDEMFSFLDEIKNENKSYKTLKKLI